MTANRSSSETAARIPRLLEHSALILLGLGGPLMTAARSPIYNSADEAAHVDYALQVWHGMLPVFENGLLLQNTVGEHPSVQWTSQHPPLFYALLAPVVGPLVDAGDINLAGMAARMVVVALALALIYAVRWVAGMLVRRPGAALGAATVVGLSVWFPVLGGTVYNDVPAALVALLALGFLIRALRDRGRWWWLAGFAAACAAGALTRFTFVPIALGLCVILIVGSAIDRRVGWARGLWGAAGAIAAMAAAAGWFYLRNLALTGSITGSHLSWFIERGLRAPRPLRDVLVDADWWKRMFQQFSPGTYGTVPVSSLTLWATVLLFVVPAVGGIVMFLVASARRTHGATDVVIAAGLVVIVGGVIFMELLHYAAGGGANIRYFFVLVVLLAPFIALALVVPLSRAALFAVWVAVRVVLLVAEVWSILGRPLVPSWQPDAGSAPVYPLATWIGFTAMIAGVLLATALVVRMRTPRRAVGG